MPKSKIIKLIADEKPEVTLDLSQYFEAGRDGKYTLDVVIAFPDGTVHKIEEDFEVKTFHPIITSEPRVVAKEELAPVIIDRKPKS